MSDKINLTTRKFQYEDYKNLPKNLQPVEYIPKVDEDGIKIDDSWFKTHNIEQTIKVLNASVLLKGICDYLQKHDVKSIEFEYYGSGDSGDMEDMSVQFNKPPSGNLKDFVRKQYRDEDDVSYDIISSDEKILPPFGTETDVLAQRWMSGKHEEVSLNLKEVIEDTMFDLLPGGWEIDEGGSGTIRLFVDTYQLDHNHTEYRREETYSDFGTNVESCTDLLDKLRLAS